MPIFTVTIKHDETGETKTVTVNTDNMEAATIPAVLTPAVSDETSEKLVGNNTSKLHGGNRRSAPSFRLKKRRITRKLKKTR